MITDHAYLTVLEWPAAWRPGDRMAAIVTAAGLHPNDAAQRTIKNPPLLVARLHPAAAEAAEASLHALGVTAMVITAPRLRATPRPLRAKRLVPAGPPGTSPRYTVELWTGQPEVLDMASVWLIVRGRLRKDRALPGDADARDGWDVDTTRMASDTFAVQPKQTTLREIVELWRREGLRIRIDGSKFNFDVLGAGRATSDSASADRLALRLATDAPRAIVDAQFSGTMPGASMITPTDIRRSRLETQRFPDDDPAFEFYSVCVAALYSRLLGQPVGP